MSNPPPLDYAQSRSRPLDVGTHIMTTIMATIYLAVPVFVLVFIVPRFEAIFKDFKTELPGITKLILSISRWTANEYGWAFLPLIIVAVVVPGLLLDLRSTTGNEVRLYRRVATRLLLVAVILFTGLAMIACVIPMLDLINAVSGPPRK